MNMAITDRCTGHCCRRFVLPYSYQEMQERKDTITDGNVIADMIIALEEDPRLVRRDGSPGFPFTCKHLQNNGDCAIYQTRPAMCRDYPYGRPCEWDECTWEQARRRSA